MASEQLQKSLSLLKRSRKYRELMRKKSRQLHLEQLEDRRVMAVAGPTLAVLTTNNGEQLLSPAGVPLANSVIKANPRELNFLFAEGQKIDSATLGGLQVVRAGVDGLTGTGDDVAITPGYVGLLDNPRSVVMRFSSALPDDAYLVTVVGSGAAPLRDQSGLPFNGGANLNIAFQLNAGAQIQAVVPQPVTRGKDLTPPDLINPLRLSQAADTVVVYFNNDQLNANPSLAGNVQNPAFYQLINAATLDIALPSTVTYSYNAATNINQAVLKFASNLAKGTYKLQIGSVVAPSNTLASAIHSGGPIDGLRAYIGDNPTPAAAPNNDVDLYRFDLAVTSNFTTTLTSVGSLNGALRIFDSNGNAIGGVTDATGAGGVESRTIVGLAAGTYYVGISSSGNVGYSTNGTLASGGLTSGTYALSVNFATPAPGLNVQQTSFVDAAANANLGIIGQAGLTVSGTISTLPYNLVFPGASDTPGHRDIPDESHLARLPATDTASVRVYAYNFQDVYGVNPQTYLPFHNAITENQKQRAREVLQLYSRYAGIQFVETANQGITIATGDLRAISSTIPTGGTVLGLADPPGLRAVMNNGVNWGNSEYGGQWFQTAMHEIGHVLGLDHAYDLPGLTIMGAGNEDLAQQYRLGTIPGEPVFPGDADILHTQSLYRPASRDINLYQFELTEAGQWSAETIAERSRATVSTNFGGSAATMQFDSVLYDAAGNGTQVVITRSNRGAGANPGISVNLVTRVVSIDLNSNANGTTADQLALLLNGNTNVTRLLTAKVVSALGTGSTNIGLTAPAASTLTLTVNSSLLDSVITVYQETTNAITGAVTRTKIARNDDYYGKDSFVDLRLGAGKYYVAVTSKGNTDFDPTVPDSGMGGLTEGAFQLKMNFLADGRYSFVRDIYGTAIDGDADGKPGGNYSFDFQSGPTIFVDKLASNPGTGSITDPYRTISAALAAAPAALASQGANGVQLIRIVGNGGTDGIVTTTGDNLPYLVGFNYNGTPLADGQDFLVPKGVTVMVDSGAILKFRRANIDVGSSAQGVDRSHAAIQVLGTPNVPAWFTAYGNDVLGGDSNGTTAPISGEWGGIVMRADSDYDHQANPIYLNYVSNANMTYGGGKVVVNSIESVYNPLHMISSRPNLSFNTITLSADAAISADPNSFDDSFGRLGPNLHANKFFNPLTQESNSLNGLLVRIRTQFGSPVDVLTLNGRLHDTDIVYIVPEALYINGSPGGPTFNGTSIISRPSARLLIDPGVTVKFNTSRIEARMGSQLIAEGTAGNPITFTALNDNRYGAGGTFRTQRTGNPLPTTLVPLGLWSGLFFGADSQGSLDFVNIFFAGGNSPIEGGFASFSPIETYQGDVRITNSLFQYNQNGQGPGGDRNGRGNNASTGGATIFVRGAQPIIVNNILRDNAGQVLSANANSMRVDLQPDYGRSTGLLGDFPQFADNAGPLVRLNRLTNNFINGMEVRGGTLTTATTWDDTDIAHVLRQEIIVPNFHSVGGLTLKSAPNESLIIKALGATAGFTAAGTFLDINDRVGGSLYVLGQPGYPVVLTSLNDDRVSAGLDPTGLPVFDTNNSSPATTGAAGDWRGLRLDQRSSDRNVATVYERESVFAGSTSFHGDPQSAQFLGNLAPDLKSGDDNRKLGFQVNGNISLNNPANVDVYSFTGDSGTEVWLDLSNTSASLQGVLELVDANGGVVARSIVRSPDHNLTMINQLTGLAENMNKDAQDTTASTTFGVPFSPNRAVFTAIASGPLYINFQRAALGIGVAPTINVAGQVITVTLNTNNSAAAPFGTTLQQLVNALNTNAQSKLLIHSRFIGNGATDISLQPTTSYASNPISFSVPQLVAAYAGRDYYSQNPLDPGFRVVLPGDGLKGTTYFVRVRSQGAADGSQDNDITKGLTTGHYQLNIRLRQMDEIPGSQIRYSTISNAIIGVDVQGLPLHSFLAGESTMALNGPNNSFGSALNMGNLLTADRNAISVAGNLAGLGDVQWFSFNIDYDLIQAINGVNAGEKTWSTIFDFDYSDGLARPDATISVFDSTGRLIYVGRDSRVDADQPAPGQGTNLNDLSRGTVGTLDPYIGAVQMPTGVPGQTHRYFVAVSSNRGLPAAMDGTFQASATTPLVRLEPINSIRRIVDDHIGSQGGATAAPPDSPAFTDITTMIGLAQHVAPYNLSDVPLFIAQRNTLGIVNPYTGAQTAGVGGFSDMVDITMRTDAVMFGYQALPGVANTAGRLVQINHENGAITVIGTDDIPDYDPATDPPNRQQVTTDNPTAMALRGHASLGLRDVEFGGDMLLFYAVPDQFSPTTSRLYRANSETGSAAVVNNRPWGRVGQLITDPTNSSYAAGTTTFGDGTAGAPSVTFTSKLAGAAGNNTRIIFDRVFDANKPAAAVTAASQVNRTVTVEINGLVKTAGATTNFGLLDNNGNTIVRVGFTAVNPGTAGNGITLDFLKADRGPGMPPLIVTDVPGKRITITLNTNPLANATTLSPTTAAELVSTLNADPFAVQLITSGIVSGNASADITTRPTNQYSPVTLAGGQDPATARDVINAVNRSTLAAPLIQQDPNPLIVGDEDEFPVTGSGNLDIDITGIAPTGSPNSYSPLFLTGGQTGIINRTTGMAFDNLNRLWGVSDSGAFYQIRTNGGGRLASNSILVPGAPVFTGLTKGPQNLYNGAYKDLFFASTASGTIYALDPAAALAGNAGAVLKQVFGSVNSVDPTPSLTASPATPPTGAIPNTVGLVFSPLDFNLFHPTGTRGGDAGHGINVSPDNHRTVGTSGGTSFYFGFEKFGAGYSGITDNPSINTFNSGGQAQYGILTNIYHQDLSVNPLIGATGSGGNYNLPGGGRGSVITNSFSLAGYSASLKPTAYVSYFVEGSLGVSIQISTDDGATWRGFSGTPVFISASITDAPDNPSQRLQPMWRDGENWRQIRVDLSEFAGQNNLRLRFNASTGISDLQHEGFYFDDIIVGFAGRGEMVTGSSPGVTNFFVTPTPVIEPGALRPPPSQVLNGPYQLEIRRGTEYGAVLSPQAGDIGLFQTYDVRDNLVQDDRDVINDGFESGIINPAVGWANTSPSPWAVVNTANRTGSFSARAGTASFVPSQTSDLTLTVTTGTGNVSFARKVSSNAGSGFLRFYIDGVLQDQWTGDLSFTTFTYPVTPGSHTFRWSYQKDSADSPVTGILDTAWIDEVRYQAPNVGFEGSPNLPAIYRTSTAPVEVNHYYGTPPGVAPILFNRLGLGELPWFVTNALANTGTQSARSAVLPPNTISDLSTVRLTGEGTMTFALRVLGNGSLELFIDGISRLVANSATHGAWTPVNLTLGAGYHNFLWRYTTAGVVAATDAAFLDDIVYPTPNIGTGTIGDQNQYREQGSIVIEANKITDSEQIGIAVRPAQRGSGGNLPYPSSVISSPTFNNSQLADGVAIFNNVVANSGQVGILFAGDPNNGQPSAAVPFGRIFNNTVYGGDTPTGTGILVQNNAGPTLLNNIVANNVLGISVDASSSRVVNGAPNTVIGTTLYQGNTTNIVFAGTQTNPIVLALGAPLFVNPQKQNFYLADGSRAIDGSVDKLDDRFNYAAVKNPLAIGLSPIIAPTTDLFGQLRADDPANDPTGGGANVFKDLGAVDRVDFEQPTARLVGPLDNDPAGLDLDPTADTVLLNNRTIFSFDIQLSDVGIGVDDGSINTSQFVITEDGTTLVDGVDYLFVYNANKHLVTFLPSSGTWKVDVRYVITLDNSATTGIMDIAGNTLLPNNSTGPNAGKTVFTIFNGVLYSFGTAPAPYPTLLVDDGPRHLIVPGMYLGTFVQPRLDGQPTANPNGDGDNGISNIILVSGLTSRFDVSASIAGKLDVWIDLNQDQQFDASEHLIDARNIPAGTSTVTFALPSSPSGSTIARFRYSSTGISLPTGEALDGEVADYRVTVNGPPFQNPGNRLDVNGDSFVSPVDALRIINLINRYIAIYGGSGNIPLPNPLALVAPDFVDTSGDGILASNDALLVINFLNNPINNPPPSGEGEGEDDGMAPASFRSTSSADAVGGGQNAIPPVLYGNSSVVLEVKSQTSSTQAVDNVFGSGQSLVVDHLQPVLDAIHPSARREQKIDAKSRQRSESDEAWDGLLGELAADIGKRRSKS